MMTFRRHLRRQAKLSGRKPDDLLVKTALSVFRNRADFERFLHDAGIPEERRFDALNAIVTLRSRVNHSYMDFRRALAPYFKLTDLVNAERLALITYSLEYRHYLDNPDRDTAFVGYEWAAPDDLKAVFRLHISGVGAEYIRDLALYEMEEGVNGTDETLDAWKAHEEGIPADLYRRLRGHASFDEILKVHTASIPSAFATAALLSGATAEQTIVAHRENIPLEYVSAL